MSNYYKFRRYKRNFNEIMKLTKKNLSNFQKIFKFKKKWIQDIDWKKYKEQQL